MFGDSLVTLRAMNVLPTILSGLGAWWFLRRRKVSAGWAVAAGCSVVASPTLLYYSRVVRYYSWPACFGSMAVLSYAEWRRTERRSWLLLAGGLELLCGYFHYLAGATIFVGVTVAMLVEWRRGRLRLTGLAAPRSDEVRRPRAVDSSRALERLRDPGAPDRPRYSSRRGESGGGAGAGRVVYPLRNLVLRELLPMGLVVHHTREVCSGWRSCVLDSSWPDVSSPGYGSRRRRPGALLPHW